MKQLVVVLGCYGLLVGSADAANRWPADVCKDLARARQVMEVGKQSAVGRAERRFGILLLQEAHCGVSVQADLDADQRVISGKAQDAPRRPMLCDTTPKANGGSYTDCF